MIDLDAMITATIPFNFFHPILKMSLSSSIYSQTSLTATTDSFSQNQDQT